MGTPAWWNLDVYLSEVISNSLRDYQRNSSSYSGTNKEAWEAKLTSIADRLEAYTNKLQSDDEAEVTRQGQQALHDLAEIFPQLWD